MNRFIVTLNVGTVEQRNAVTEIFRMKGWPLWHWMEDVWLLAKVPESINAKEITEILMEHPVIGKKAHLVLRIPQGSAAPYWGQCHPDAWKWMKEFWDSPMDEEGPTIPGLTTFNMQ